MPKGTIQAVLFAQCSSLGENICLIDVCLVLISYSDEPDGRGFESAEHLNEIALERRCKIINIMVEGVTGAAPKAKEMTRPAGPVLAMCSVVLKVCNDRDTHHELP